MYTNISQAGKRVPALAEISGEVPSGAILTVGSSGSGKSTLLSLCNLLLTPDNGEIRIHGKEVREWNIPELRRKVGMVFQTPTMLSGTVRDNLTVGARLNGFEVKESEQLILRMGLSQEMLLRNAQDLSGGQKQRLSLARTLVNQPSVLLLDEITSALDITSARAVEDLILQINREQKTTVLWVTHDLAQARRVGDLTWLLVDALTSIVLAFLAYFCLFNEHQQRIDQSSN